MARTLSTKTKSSVWMGNSIGITDITSVTISNHVTSIVSITGITSIHNITCITNVTFIPCITDVIQWSKP